MNMNNINNNIKKKKMKIINNNNIINKIMNIKIKNIKMIFNKI